MKLKLALLSTAIFLSACAGSHSERIVTKGPLICAADEICPDLSIGWIEDKRNGFKIAAEISNPVKYDIKQLKFIVDGQSYEYSTLKATQFITIAGITTSSNHIYVPVSFLNSFRDAKNIELSIVTDQGEITRSILKENGEKSSAYLTFIKGYTTQTIKNVENNEQAK